MLPLVEVLPRVVPSEPLRADRALMGQPAVARAYVPKDRPAVASAARCRLVVYCRQAMALTAARVSAAVVDEGIATRSSSIG